MLQEVDEEKYFIVLIGAHLKLCAPQIRCSGFKGEEATSRVTKLRLKGFNRQLALCTAILSSKFTAGLPVLLSQHYDEEGVVFQVSMPTVYSSWVRTL